MLTFTNFTTTVSFADFSAENWNTLVRDSISPEYMSWNETEIQILQNAHQGTTLTLKNYIDQMLNRAINHYNGVLTIAYNKIATLEVEVVHFWRELVKLPCYKSPKKETVSYAFKHLIQNLKLYNGVKV